MMTLHSRVMLALSLVTTLLLLSTVTQAENDQRRPDVRVVIDISGSMKQNDPQNLRQPALELLVQLMPEDAQAGVWTFGQWVNMLVSHGPVDDAWRQQAMAAAKKINSVALFTNIPLALEKAVNDLDRLDPAFDTSLILLTDGMVDVSKSLEENAQARERVLTEILPRLRAAGVTVHTVALSANADTELMERLALDTNGLSSVAASADDLMAIFLRAFDAAAPAEQLPLEGNRFLVDSSVTELTVLVFRKPGSEPTRLLAPDGSRYQGSNRAEGVSWFAQPDYDLVTVTKPYEGEWAINADLEPNSRVTIVSNLSLAVNRLPKTLFTDSPQIPVLTASLQQQGEPVADQSLLDLLTLQLKVTRKKTGRAGSRR